MQSRHPARARIRQFTGMLVKCVKNTKATTKSSESGRMGSTIQTGTVDGFTIWITQVMRSIFRFNILDLLFLWINGWLTGWMCFVVPYFVTGLSRESERKGLESQDSQFDTTGQLWLNNGKFHGVFLRRMALWLYDSVNSFIGGMALNCVCHEEHSGGNLLQPALTHSLKQYPGWPAYSIFIGCNDATINLSVPQQQQPNCKQEAPCSDIIIALPKALSRMFLLVCR